MQSSLLMRRTHFLFRRESNRMPPQCSPCNIHGWSIDCYSSGNYLKRESSCAFLMDCACLGLLYMDRELVWRSLILFSQTLAGAAFWGGGVGGGDAELRSSLHISRVLPGWRARLTLGPAGDEFSLARCHPTRRTTASFSFFFLSSQSPLPLCFRHSQLFWSFPCCWSAWPFKKFSLTSPRRSWKWFILPFLLCLDAIWWAFPKVQTQQFWPANTLHFIWRNTLQA